MPGGMPGCKGSKPARELFLDRQLPPENLREKNRNDTMKKSATLIFLFYALTLLAQTPQFTWNYPAVTSQTHQYLLDASGNENDYFTSILAGTRDHVALSSVQAFKESWMRLFRPDDSSAFYRQRSTTKGQTWDLRFQLFTGYEYVRPDGEDAFSLPYYGGTIAGRIGTQLSFFADMWKGHYSNNVTYAFNNSPLIKSWVQFNDDHTQVYVDKVRARMQYDTAVGRFAVGRGTYQIGSNIGGSIILSDAQNDYGYLSANWEIGQLSVSFLHATLIPDSTTTSQEKDYADKYLATHILDWHPSNRFHAFFGEHVVYGNRSLDASYLLPHTIMRITEHNLNDRDNVLMFAGTELAYGTGNTFYFNASMDEFSSSELGTDSWKNKFALQLGNAIYLGKMRFCTEFTAVRPWMYTHRFLVSKFSHNGHPLGFPDGSNLIQYAGELNLPLPYRSTLNIHGAYTRQGSLGNSFTINYESRPSDSAPWLAGTITDISDVVANLAVRTLAHHLLSLGYHYRYSTDALGATNEITLAYQVRY